MNEIYLLFTDEQMKILNSESWQNQAIEWKSENLQLNWNGGFSTNWTDAMLSTESTVDSVDM